MIRREEEDCSKNNPTKKEEFKVIVSLYRVRKEDPLYLLLPLSYNCQSTCDIVKTVFVDFRESSLKSSWKVVPLFIIPSSCDTPSSLLHPQSEESVSRMAFYSQVPPIQLYAYAPMAIPNQPEFYAVYPSGSAAGVVDASAFYYDGNPKGMMGQSGESTFTCHVTSILYFYPPPRP